MATQEFTPKVEEVKIDPSQIKQQYSQMNQQAEQAMSQQPLTEEEIRKQVAAEEQRLDLMLPYYRKQAESLELEIAITTAEVRMGKIPAKSVPGIIGKQLEIEEMRTKLEWASIMMQQQQTLESLNKKKEELQNTDSSRVDSTSTSTKTAE